MTSPRRLSLSALWGDIQRGVNEHIGTAELWQMARDAATARGFDGVSGGIAEMNRLRGTAGAIREAALRFAKMGTNELITPSVFAPDINAQSIAGRSLTPVFRVRFEHTVTTSTGEQVTTHRTVSFPFQLPPTKAALLEELNLNAAAMAEQYGEINNGVDGIEITIV